MKELPRLDKTIVDKRKALAAHDVTLDGHPARITGFHLEFAHVSVKPNGYGFQWPWEAVERIINKGGQFYS